MKEELNKEEEKRNVRNGSEKKRKGNETKQ
jgi:hypothetical protein